MAEQLTPQQKLAVENRGGRLLVSAAAGSGKTKVLVDRLMGYLTDPVAPADLDEFLIITYTKAAASELRSKIAAKLTERIAREPNNRHLQKQLQRLYLTQISTVHSFCTNVLREYAYRLDIPADFRVAEEAECRELQDTVLQELLDRSYDQNLSDPDFTALLDTQGLGRDDRQIPELVIKVYNSARCHLDPSKWMADCLNQMKTEDISDVGQTIWGKYLMQDLFACLDRQIPVLEQCAARLAAADKMEKHTEALKEQMLCLRELRGAESWDRIVSLKNIPYARWPVCKKGGDKELAEQAKAVRDACKKSLAGKLAAFSDESAVLLEDLQTTAAAASGLIGLVTRFAEDYQRMKRSRRIMDFSDLEHRMLDLLLGASRGEQTAAAREIGRRFREIMVDEYQDSNAVQDAIFMALTRERQNCFMVGDVKQSIYQFRLAEPGIFLEKYRSYGNPEDAQPGEGRRILLSDNFRSGGEVIEAVNDVFCRCMSEQVGGLSYGESEALREGISHTPLPDPAVELHVLRTEDKEADEAAFVARRIRQMLDQKTPIRDGDGFRPVAAGDIVILLRSLRSVAKDYQRALENVGIGCNAGEGDLLQAEEVATVRSLLQTIANPRQDIPLVSTLASPLFGFTADDLAAFRSGRKNMSIYDALLQSDLPKAKEFLDTLAILRREAKMSPLSQLLERCFALTRADSIFGAMSEGASRKMNLRQFYRLASDYEKTGTRTLNQFLEHLDAAEEKGLKADSGNAQGAVTLMTIHSSKGLEFPVVFLCGLSRKFNTESGKEQVLCDRELYLGLKTADSRTRIRYPSVSHRAVRMKMTADGISEELRVLYVAMTRARDRLIMTYAGKKPENAIRDIGLRYPFDNGAMLCREASCPGDWILITAMQHTEAGALFAASEVHPETELPAHPWKITLAESRQEEKKFLQENKTIFDLPEKNMEELKAGLAFRYAHPAATQAPSKQTATGRKGRFRDAEAAEDAPEHSVIRSWRSPAFLSRQKDGRAYGNAMHCAMQYIRYENCGSAESVEKELRRLVAEGFLTEEQGSMVDSRQIAAFFGTPVGKRLAGGAPCLREFKFSILDDAARYGEGLEGEQVLLQGVVDCALLEEDGITVLDFKTDYVTEDTAADAVARYRIQVQTYADALTRIYRKPVKECMLYFFRLGAFFPV